MSVLFLILLITILIYLVWPQIRLWIARKVIERIGEQMQQQARNSQQGRANQQSSTKDEPHYREKVDMHDIETRRFDKENSDDYVDFEELPK